MPSRCCEFVDSRLRRSPPDRASAVPYGQAGENAMRFPHLDHRSAADHKLHSTPQQQGMNLISGNDETSSRLPAFSLCLPGSCPNNRDRRSADIIRRRLDYWTLILGPKFSAKERKQFQLSRFYAITQIEYCRNFIFKRHFPIHKLFDRSCELGLWRLTADNIAEIFGTRVHRRIKMASSPPSSTASNTPSCLPRLLQTRLFEAVRKALHLSAQ